jgi:uncharacterized membrane protein
VALFTGLGALKYSVHRNLVDFGIFTQTAAAAFGCFCNPIEGSHWAFHFSPILYGGSLALDVVRSPLTLVALQAIAGALLAPPIYALALRGGGDVTTARLAAVVVWLYPPLAGLVFGDVHENGFAPAAVAWMLYAFDAGRLAWTLVLALLVLAVKEDQAFFLTIAGALGAWRFRGTLRGRVALAIALCSVLVLVAFFGVIQPQAQSLASPGWQPERFYAWNTADLAGLAQGVLARLGFLLLVFVPLLLLPLRSPMIWPAAAPFAEVLFSRMPTTYTLGTHYTGAWLGYVLVAFAFGLRGLPQRRARTMLAICAALCVLELAVADPLHPGINLRAVAPRDVALDAFLTSLPRDATLATQEEAYTHLALSDPLATLLPEAAERETDACFILIDRDFPDSARLQEYGATVRRLVREGRYVAAERQGGIELYASSSASADSARTGQPSSARTMRWGAAHGAHRATCGR